MKNTTGKIRMGGMVVLSVVLFCMGGDAFAQATWARTYGGAGLDEAWSVQQTSDGGYVVAGWTYSFGAGSHDFWVLKLDASSNVTWQKTYGGASNDFVYSIQQTTDGGYIVAGWTGSFGAGGYDLWVLKLDASGNVTWQKTYGGAGADYAWSIQQTTDGGFVVAGGTGSFGAGGYDLWVLKLDASGNVQWQKTYGGAGQEGWDLVDIKQTTDGGFVVAGETTSFGAGSYYYWVLKLDASGNVTWQKTFGGTGSDRAYSIQQTTDGGYVVAGWTNSFGAGGYDVWVLKLDASGNVTWQKTYGGAGDDRAYSIQQTTDGDFVVAGYTFVGASDIDVWVLKLDALGNVTWQKAYGGASFDLAHSIQQTTDGGFVVAGWTGSFGAGFADFWVLKLDANGEIDASCTFIADTAVTDANTAVTPANTAVTGADSPAVPADTTVTGVVSTATVIDQCACPQPSSGCTPAGSTYPTDMLLPCDFCVDGLDLGVIGRAFGESCGETYYNNDADLDASGTVDGADLDTLIFDFGKGCGFLLPGAWRRRKKAKRKKRSWRTLAAVFAALGLMTMAACGGGGGGGGAGPSYTATYTEPANTAPGNVVLKLNAEGATLVLDVVVYGPLTNVYNIAFHLQYDPVILQYQSKSEGSVFDADNCNGGDCTTFTIDSTTVANKLLVGLTRKEPGVGVAFGAGANVVMTLTFRPDAPGGPSSFVFSATELKDKDSVDISTGWFAGSVEVT